MSLINKHRQSYSQQNLNYYKRLQAGPAAIAVDRVGDPTARRWLMEQPQSRRLASSDRVIAVLARQQRKLVDEVLRVALRDGSEVFLAYLRPVGPTRALQALSSAIA